MYLCIEYILPFRLIMYVLYSFTRSFCTFYTGLLFTRAMAQVNLLSMLRQPADEPVSKYCDPFKGLGTIKVKAEIHTDPINVTPVIDPPCRILSAIDLDVKLDCIIKLAVIVKQDEPTLWVSSITILRKPGKIRV